MCLPWYQRFRRFIFVNIKIEVLDMIRIVWYVCNEIKFFLAGIPAKCTCNLNEALQLSESLNTSLKHHWNLQRRPLLTHSMQVLINVVGMEYLVALTRSHELNGFGQLHQYLLISMPKLSNQLDIFAGMTT